ncbi:MAG: leucyl aminopeptidase [Thermodesulfobacteriota bacterium]|nr:leucyl aminopeptidase [Thermodesulfobacteriota bacterium]
MLRLIKGDLYKLQTDAVVIPVAEDAQLHENEQVIFLTEKTGTATEFRGAKGDELTLYNLPEVKSPRVIFLGLGKINKIDAESLRALCGRAVKKCIKSKLKNMIIAAPSSVKLGMETGEVLEPMLEGAFLGNHVFSKYKEEKKNRPLEKAGLYTEPQIMSVFSGLPLQVETVCAGTLLAREWVSTPSNYKKPEQFAKKISSAAGNENLAIKVFKNKYLIRLGFGAMVAVGAGSRNKPVFLILKYNPKGAKKTIALIGKGITFDSGGINLKPPGSLEDMKMDMAGAAAVAATLISAAKMKPKMRIIGAIPIVENMPSGDATRPGDIITGYNGKTIEINNTDAEGRLILADAISYVLKEERPDIMIDVATLTGACVIALGEKIAGLFSPDDELADKIIESAKKTGERCWRMPLPDDYREYLKSEFADISNMSSSRWGGAITAALFLSEFIKDTRWAHIDIAGPAYIKKETDYCGAGGTGFGVRLLCDLIQKL